MPSPCGTCSGLFTKMEDLASLFLMPITNKKKCTWGGEVLQMVINFALYPWLKAREVQIAKLPALVFSS